MFICVKGKTASLVFQAENSKPRRLESTTMLRTVCGECHHFFLYYKFRESAGMVRDRQNGKRREKSCQEFQEQSWIQHLSFCLDGACKNGLPGGNGYQ